MNARRVILIALSSYILLTSAPVLAQQKSENAELLAMSGQRER
jgi:hypothetical protein